MVYYTTRYNIEKNQLHIACAVLEPDHYVVVVVLW